MIEGEPAETVSHVLSWLARPLALRKSGRLVNGEWPDVMLVVLKGENRIESANMQEGFEIKTFDDAARVNTRALNFYTRQLKLM